MPFQGPQLFLTGSPPAILPLYDTLFPMKTVFVIEHMTKRELTLPAKRWRVAERLTGPRGMLSEGWNLIKKDLSFAGALHELRLQRAQQNLSPPPQPSAQLHLDRG